MNTHEFWQLIVEQIILLPPQASAERQTGARAVNASKQLIAASRVDGVQRGTQRRDALLCRD